jgi:hypothetical protein
MDFLGILGSVLDAIGGVFNDIGEYLNKVLAIIWGDIKDVGDALKSVTDAIWKALNTIWTWLKEAWDWLKTNVIEPIHSWIHSVTQWLHQTLQPLIDWINQIRSMYEWYWNNILKPALNFIQRLRQFLLVFRLLGFKWAIQLDDYLSEAEQKLEQGFLYVWANLNLLAEWVNFIMDPFGLFQPQLFQGTVLRDVGAIYAAVWDATQAPVSGDQQKVASQDLALFAPGAAVSTSNSLAQGIPNPTLQAYNQAIQAEIPQLGTGN